MSRFFTISEAVDLRLLSNEDYQKRDRMRLLKWSKFVWQDLNITAIKKATRKKFAINKRTMSVDLPCNTLQLSSVSVVDKCGVEYPVYRNKRIFDNSDIVDVGAAKNCACEFECNNTLCNTIKNYEAVIETLQDYTPTSGSNLVDFECVSRKGIDDQGFFYEQKQYPKRIYTDGVWTDTILYTETNKLCKVETDDNGCVCDTEANIEALCSCCNINDVNTSLCCIGGTAEEPPKDNCDTWIYRCNTKMDWFMTQCGCFPYCCNSENIYNISELGDRLLFPHNFGWDNVIVRYYEDLSGPDLQIPIIALNTFVVGLMWWDCQFNDKKQALADKYGLQYSRMKGGLVKEINKYRIAELAMIVAPPRFIPSFIAGRTNQYEGNYRFFYN